MESATSSRIKFYINSNLVLNKVVGDLMTGDYTGLGTPNMPYGYWDWLRYDNFVIRKQN